LRPRSLARRPPLDHVLIYCCCCCCCCTLFACLCLPPPASACLPGQASHPRIHIRLRLASCVEPLRLHASPPTYRTESIVRQVGPCNPVLDSPVHTTSPAFQHCHPPQHNTSPPPPTLFPYPRILHAQPRGTPSLATCHSSITTPRRRLPSAKLVPPLHLRAECAGVHCARRTSVTATFLNPDPLTHTPHLCDRKAFVKAAAACASRWKSRRTTGATSYTFAPVPARTSPRSTTARAHQTKPRNHSLRIRSVSSTRMCVRCWIPIRAVSMKVSGTPIFKMSCTSHETNTTQST
jgi:hypothetical protein